MSQLDEEQQIDRLLKCFSDARWDIVGRAMEILEAGLNTPEFPLDIVPAMKNDYVAYKIPGHQTVPDHVIPTPPRCTCPIDMLMAHGCQCGGV